jgi:hypothetical protein
MSKIDTATERADDFHFFGQTRATQHGKIVVILDEQDPRPITGKCVELPKRSRPQACLRQHHPQPRHAVCVGDRQQPACQAPVDVGLDAVIDHEVRARLPDDSTISQKGREFLDRARAI